MGTSIAGNCYVYSIDYNPEHTHVLGGSTSAYTHACWRVTHRHTHVPEDNTSAHTHAGGNTSAHTRAGGDTSAHTRAGG